jgi:hypothetical protein
VFGLAPIATATVYEDTDVLLLGRALIAASGQRRPLVPADLSTLTVQVFDRDTPVGLTLTLTPAIVVHATLQTGDIWPPELDDEDWQGFNVEIPLARAYLPAGGRTYQAVATFLTTGGKQFPGVFQITTRDLPGQ